MCVYLFLRPKKSHNSPTLHFRLVLFASTKLGAGPSKKPWKGGG